MNCLSCGKPIIIKRTFKTFATPEYQKICSKCFSKMRNLSPLVVLPNELDLMYVYELLYELNTDAALFYSYLHPYICSYLVYQKQYTLFIFDILDEKTLELLTCLSIGPMIVLTIKIKGEMLI